MLLKGTAGIALARSTLVKDSLGPVVLGLGSVPSICWLPLAILWLGLSEWAIQLVVVLGAALPVAVATESAVRHVPPAFERAARTMGARGVRLMLTVTLPAALCPGSSRALRWAGPCAALAHGGGTLVRLQEGLGQLLETGRDDTTRTWCWPS